MWLNSIPLAFSNSSSFWQQEEKQRQQQEPPFIQLYYAAAISTAAAEHNRAWRDTKKRAETFQPLTQNNPNKKINKQTKKKMGKCLLTKFNFVSMVSLLPAPGARDSRKDS